MPPVRASTERDGRDEAGGWADMQLWCPHPLVRICLSGAPGRLVGTGARPVRARSFAWVDLSFLPIGRRRADGSRHRRVQPHPACRIDMGAHHGMLDARILVPFPGTHPDTVGQGAQHRRAP